MQPRPIPVEVARRLAIHKQHLSAAPSVGLLQTVSDLGCLQLDPISAVARSHEIVLWSRGQTDLAALEALRFCTFDVFEYWAHQASIVTTADYPIFQHAMKRHPPGQDDDSLALRAWVQENEPLRQTILGRLRHEGPLPSRSFSSTTDRVVGSTGWTSGRDVTHMMDYLWHSGCVIVARREGTQRLWGLAEYYLPPWTPREDLDDDTLTERAAQRALRALGVATLPQIRQHFTRRRYPGLAQVMARLERAGIIEQVVVLDADGLPVFRGPTYIHRDDLPLVDAIQAGGFQGRTTLLSPFDNLICDRARTEQLFGFRYRMEIYVPEPKREFGYYVLPILHGDRLIGRADARYDRKTQTLVIPAVYREAEAPDARSAVRTTIASLAAWLGARHINIHRDSFA